MSHFWIIEEQKVKKIARETAVFLNFHPKGAMLAKCLPVAAELLCQNPLKVRYIALQVAEIALSQFFPKTFSLISHGAYLVEGLYQRRFLTSFHHGIQIAAIAYNAPFIAILSFASTSLGYLQEMYDSYQKGEFIEMSLEGGLFAIFGYQTYDLCQNYRSKRQFDLICKGINIEEEEISKDYGIDRSLQQSQFTSEDGLKNWTGKEDTPLLGEDLDVFLKNHHFSSHIKRLSIDLTSMPCKKIRHVIFDSCSFGHLQDVIFEHCIFIGSSFEKGILEGCKMHHCQFYETTFKRAYMGLCELSHCFFEDCILDRWILFHTKMEFCELLKCSMRQAQIFFAYIYSCIAKRVNFENTVMGVNCRFDLLENCKLRDESRPVVAIGAYLSAREAYGKCIETVLIEKGADVILFEKLPDVSQDLLCEAVDEGLIRFSKGGYQSRAKAILESSSPQIVQIKKLANAIIAQVDGIVLPGGDHVPREFYCETEKRSEKLGYALQEFALLSCALKQGKPVLGICRGLQMMNVFLGGTLKEVKHGYGYQTISFCASRVNGAVQNIFDKTIQKGRIYAYSNHAEGVDKIATDLVPIFEYKGVIKGAMDKDGRYIGLQFHPEDVINTRRHCFHILEDITDVCIEYKNLISKTLDNYEQSRDIYGNWIARLRSYHCSPYTEMDSKFGL